MNPLGLLALISIPIILYLHLFRKKNIVHRVSSLLLWQAKRQTSDTGKTKKPINQSLSMWLEIFTVICLSLVLAQPRGCSTTTATHTVIIIDTSASMNGNEYWKEVQQAIQNTIRTAEDNETWTIITAGHQPRIVAGPRAKNSIALYTLQDVKSHATSTNLYQAIQLAESLVPDSILVFTDHSPVETPRNNVGWYSTATGQKNVGFVQAEWRESEISFSLLNASDYPAKGKLHIEDAENKQQTKKLDFTANQLIHLSIPATTDSIKIEYQPESEDGLSLDNTVQLTRPKPRELKIAIDMNKSLAQALGLSSSTGTAPISRIINPFSIVSPMEADFLFSDRNIGGSPNTWKLTVHKSTSKPQFSQNDAFVDQRHPLLQDVSLNNVIWNYSEEIQLKGKPLIQHETTNLLTEEIQNQGKRKIYHLNFQPERSTFHLHTTWPIFLSELLEARREQLPGLSASNLRPQENIKVLDATPGPWTIVTPSQTIEKFHEKGMLLFEVEEIGSYQISNATEKHTVQTNLLTTKETDLRHRKSHQKKAQQVSRKTVAKSADPLLSLLILLALIFISFNWNITQSKR